MLHNRTEQTEWDFVNIANVDIDRQFESLKKLFTDNLQICFTNQIEINKANSAKFQKQFCLV